MDFQSLIELGNKGTDPAQADVVLQPSDSVPGIGRIRPQKTAPEAGMEKLL